MEYSDLVSKLNDKIVDVLEPIITNDYIYLNLPYHANIGDILIWKGTEFKCDMIKTGVSFLSKYDKIYTTRLHGAILCCLLQKPFVLFDNSYGKNSSFFQTWLNDVDGMNLVY